jgi:hypothetical protein
VDQGDSKIPKLRHSITFETWLEIRSERKLHVQKKKSQICRRVLNCEYLDSESIVLSTAKAGARRNENY